MPAYLESSEIETKLEDLEKSLRTYGGPSLITVMASDDATAEVAERSGLARVIRCGRLGKPAALNEAVAASEADVVVFTDANCQIRPENWPELAVDRLSEFSLVSALKAERSGSDRLFWVYEKFVKRSGSSAQATLGVVGEFVALRRADFNDLPVRTLLDDMVLALDLADRGLASCVDPRIATVEDPPGQRDQWTRRVRMCEGVLRECLARRRSLVRHPLGRRLLLHKFYRVTLGCLGFWLAAASAMLLVPVPLAILMALVLSVACAAYSGRLNVPVPLAAIFSPIGMQAVPISTLVKMIRVSRSRGPASLGWEKVAR